MRLFGISIKNLSGVSKTIALMADINGNGVINRGKERGLYEAAKEAISGNSFIFNGETYVFGDENKTKNNQKEVDYNSSFTIDNSTEFNSVIVPLGKSNSSSEKHLPTENLQIQEKVSSNNNKVSNPAGFSNKYDDKILEYSNKYGLDSNMVKAIIQNESSFNPNATSSANCQGLMQVNPKFNGGNLYDVDTNLDSGCRIFRNCLDSFNGDNTKALIAYNRGVTGAKKVLNKGITETTYSKKVLANYEKLNSNKNFEYNA